MSIPFRILRELLLHPEGLNEGEEEELAGFRRRVAVLDDRGGCDLSRVPVLDAFEEGYYARSAFPDDCS